MIRTGDLAEEINDAIARCNRGGADYQLPDDFDCYPVLEVDANGKCVGIAHWQASIADHVSTGSSPELAVYGICKGPVTP